MAKLQFILFIVIACMAYSSARPARKDEHSRRLAGHDRSTASKRHADVNVSTELAKRLRSRQRIEVLRRLINNAEPGQKSITYEQVMQASPRQSERIKRKLEHLGVRSTIGVQIYPHKDAVPDHRETSKRLLSHLNGQTTNDNLRVRVVNHRPVTTPLRIQDYTRQADTLRQQAAMATTCLELQDTLLKMPSLRIKVKCASTVPQRPAPPVRLDRSYARPAGIVNYGYVPARRVYFNDHTRNNGLTLSRRHTHRRSRSRPRSPYYRG